MRVLALTTQLKPKKLVTDLVGSLHAGHRVRIELITVVPPRSTLPVDRVDAVDLSLVPFRPLIPVSGEGLDSRGGPGRVVARAWRTLRRVRAKVRRRPPRIDPARALEVACATSLALGRRAAAVDVVVALDPGAVRGAAKLGRRTDHPAIVFGARRVPRALKMQAQDLSTAGVAAVEDTPSGVEALPILVPAARSLLIAPANYAGQAAAWAGAVRQYVPGTTALNAQVGVHPRFPFPTDYEISKDTFGGSLRWRLAWRDFVLGNFTHVIAEANRPLLGAVSGDGHGDLAELRRAGKTVALLSHGSDARIPSMHAAREPWHSYDALEPKKLENLERASRRNVELYNQYDGTVFVSTPGLITFIPEAIWLPLVIDYDQWHGSRPVLEGDLPVVAHIPSSSQKGSHMIDPILRDLDHRGLIRYVRVEGVRHEEMPARYGSADIVVEQFGIADYSTAACEAMAAGRVVVSRVADEVRDRVKRQTGLELPIVEANPTTLERVILDLVADPDRARRVAAEGQEFCRTVHDGRRSADVLRTWLDGDTPR